MKPTKDEIQEGKDLERMFLQGEAEIGQRVLPEHIIPPDEIADVSLVTEVEVKEGVVHKILRFLSGGSE